MRLQSSSLQRKFQSSPGPKAGCYVYRPPLHRPTDVSILTRPEGRVLHPVDHDVDGARAVSILTRPEGRVLPLPGDAATLHDLVSILTRPEGRVLQHSAYLWQSGNWQFQSSPGPKAWCYTTS